MEIQYAETKEDISVLVFIKALFADTDFVTVVDEYPDTELTIPTVSVEQGTTILTEYEMGNRSGRRIREYVINIFARNKSQRDDYSYRVVNALENGIIVYNYNEGFPPEVTPTVLEHLNVVSRRIIPIEVLPELVEKLYFRSMVKFVATNDRD